MRKAKQDGESLESFTAFRAFWPFTAIKYYSRTEAAEDY